MFVQILSGLQKSNICCVFCKLIHSALQLLLLKYLLYRCFLVLHPAQNSTLKDLIWIICCFHVHQVKKTDCAKQCTNQQTGANITNALIVVVYRNIAGSDFWWHWRWLMICVVILTFCVCWHVCSALLSWEVCFWLVCILIIFSLTCF